MKRKLITVLLMMGTVACVGLSGCGGNGENSGRGLRGENAEDGDTADRSMPEEKEENGKEGDGKTDSGNTDAGNQTNATPGAAAEGTLAERLCGRYSKPIEGTEEEYSTIEIFEFYGNLLAYATQAIEDGDSLHSYSIWAVELLPELEDTFLSTDGKTGDAYAYAFSIMSNAGLYWSETPKGSITANGNDVTIRGLDGVIESGEYVPDERVEHCFTYYEEADDPSLAPYAGLWEMQMQDVPVYMEISDKGQIRLFSKAPMTEVFFACGNATFEDESTLKLTFNTIDYGAPYILECEFFGTGEESICLIPDEDVLRTDDSYIFQRGVHAVFDPIDADEVEVYCLGLDTDGGDDDAAYPEANCSDISEVGLSDNFYGVWVAAFKDYDQAYDLSMELYDKGFDEVQIAASTDFSNLNKDLYYCVAAVMTYDKTEADAVLKDVKNAGYSSAYVKNAGNYTAGRYQFTVYDRGRVEVGDDRAVFHGVSVAPAHGCTLPPYEDYTMDLIVDENTVFAPDGDLGGFGEIADKKDALGWIQGKAEVEDEDSQLALIGVFEATITGNHVDAFYGSYWWD